MIVIYLMLVSLSHWEAKAVESLLKCDDLSLSHPIEHTRLLCYASKQSSHRLVDKDLVGCEAHRVADHCAFPVSAAERCIIVDPCQTRVVLANSHHHGHVGQSGWGSWSSNQYV